MILEKVLNDENKCKLLFKCINGVTNDINYYEKWIKIVYIKKINGNLFDFINFAKGKCHIYFLYWILMIFSVDSQIFFMGKIHSSIKKIIQIN